MLCSAFFSGSETALFSLSRLDLEKLRNTRDPRSQKIHELLDEPRRLIISILCGNELVNIASAANMAAILIMMLGDNNPNTEWVNIAIMVPLLLLFGEVTPKTFAVTFPIKFSSSLSARLLPKWILLITPIRKVVRLVADRLTTAIVGSPPASENILYQDEFRVILEEGEATGVIEATERVLIDNILKGSETEIINIMTPRTRINFLNSALPFPDLVKRFRKFKHPRVPVARKRLDNIMGFLHSEDLLRLVYNKIDPETVNIEDVLKPAYFVPPTKTVDEMFEYFQHHQTRAAIVLGEYGGVEGIVTMKDVLTFIFGEISGKMKGQEDFREEGDGYTVPGDMRLDDFNNISNFNVEDPMMTTIGGFAFRQFDRLPEVGESISRDGLTFTVVKMAKLRIKALHVAPGPVRKGRLEDEMLLPVPDEVQVDEDQLDNGEAFEEAFDLTASEGDNLGDEDAANAVVPEEGPAVDLTSRNETITSSPGEGKEIDTPILESETDKVNQEHEITPPPPDLLDSVMPGKEEMPSDDMSRPSGQSEAEPSRSEVESAVETKAPNQGVIPGIVEPKPAKPTVSNPGLVGPEQVQARMKEPEPVADPPDSEPDPPDSEPDPQIRAKAAKQKNKPKPAEATAKTDPKSQATPTPSKTKNQPKKDSQKQSRESESDTTEKVH